MSKFSPEDRERILAEVRRNIECADAAANIAREYHLRPPDDPSAGTLANPQQDRLEKRPRDADEAEAKHATERATHDEDALEARLVAKVTQLLDQRIKELRSDLGDVAKAVGKLVEGVSGAINDLRDAAHEPARVANQHVEALFERLDRKLDELAPPRGSDDDGVIDLPNPLRSVN